MGTGLQVSFHLKTTWLIDLLQCKSVLQFYNFTLKSLRTDFVCQNGCHSTVAYFDKQYLQLKDNS